MKSEHKPGCPRLMFWDAGEYQAPCTCDVDGAPEDDITVWLREQEECGCIEAANEIVQLRASVAELEAELADYGQELTNRTDGALEMTRERNEALSRVVEVERALREAKRQLVFAANWTGDKPLGKAVIENAAAAYAILDRADTGEGER